jgi:hypothetical protein
VAAPLGETSSQRINPRHVKVSSVFLIPQIKGDSQMSTKKTKEVKFETLKPVDRERAENSPDTARSKNNAVRDSRTSLGRLMPSEIVTD